MQGQMQRKKPHKDRWNNVWENECLFVQYIIIYNLQSMAEHNKLHASDIRPPSQIMLMRRMVHSCHWVRSNIFWDVFQFVWINYTHQPLMCLIFMTIVESCCHGDETGPCRKPTVVTPFLVPDQRRFLLLDTNQFILVRVAVRWGLICLLQCTRKRFTWRLVCTITAKMRTTIILAITIINRNHFSKVFYFCRGKEKKFRTGRN